ncbi:MAG: hypothetical protein R3250_14510, partial [Melioribacteraceae bacterium]|nr:hypothetical protein [Melioribacteraceae bacterium]
IFIFALLFISGCSDRRSELKITDTILDDSSSYFYTDFEIYKNKDKRLPIGVFDSGTGGLTVLDAIVNFDKYNNSDRTFTEIGDSNKDFSKEYFIYLADQANMPYGNYAAANQTDLLREHIFKDMQFLMSDKYYRDVEDVDYQTDKSPIKAMVIACNTATAFGKQDIQAFLTTAGIDIKVIGVIGAGVRAALKSMSNDQDECAAVMATAGTVASEGYIKEFNHQLNLHNRSNDISIYQQAGVGLAGAIDGSTEFIDPSASQPRDTYKGPSDYNKHLKIDTKILERYNFDWSGNKMLYEGSVTDPKKIQINSVDNYIAYHVTSLAEKIISKNDSSKLSTVVLGCTHYPFYTELFRQKFADLRVYKENDKYIYKNIIADKIEFIDPAINTAQELYEFLKAENLFNDMNIKESEFYISMPNINNPDVIVDANGNLPYEYKYGRKVDHIQEYVKRTPFNRNNISDPVLSRLKEKIPFTYELIREFNASSKKTEFLSETARIR